MQDLLSLRGYHVKVYEFINPLYSATVGPGSIHNNSGLVMSQSPAVAKNTSNWLLDKQWLFTEQIQVLHSWVDLEYKQKCSSVACWYNVELTTQVPGFESH